MADRLHNTNVSDAARQNYPQRPILLTCASNSSSSNDPAESARANDSRQSYSDSRQQSTTSLSGLKHYSDNLYSLIDGNLNRKRVSRRSMSIVNPLLESLSGMQKMLITKQEVLMCKSRIMKRDVKYSLQNADENLDLEDPFQSEGFSLNAEDPNALEFKLQEIEESDLEESQTYFCGKFTERLEQLFNDKMFSITLTEHERTRTIGSVRLINGEYHVYDHNENEVFQAVRVNDAKEKHQIVILKRGDDEEIEREFGSVDLGQWHTLTLEAEISFGGFCSAKEKLLILGTVLVMMMKMQPGQTLPRRNNMDGACSVGGLWREVLDKMRSLF